MPHPRARGRQHTGPLGPGDRLGAETRFLGEAGRQQPRRDQGPPRAVHRRHGRATAASCGRARPSWSPPAGPSAWAWRWPASCYGHPVTLVTDPGMEPLMRRLLSAYGARVEVVAEPHPVGGWQQARRERRARAAGRTARRLLPGPVQQPRQRRRLRGRWPPNWPPSSDRIDVLVCSVGTGGHSAGRLPRAAAALSRTCGCRRRHHRLDDLRPARAAPADARPGQQHPPAQRRLRRCSTRSTGSRPPEAVWACRRLAALRSYATGGWSIGAVALVAAWLARTLPSPDAGSRRSSPTARTATSTPSTTTTTAPRTTCSARPPATARRRSATRRARGHPLDPLHHRDRSRSPDRGTRRRHRRSGRVRRLGGSLKRCTQVRPSTAPVQLLMVNQFTINLGFYMLMPYLAAHLSGTLALAGWVVGLVLGVRNSASRACSWSAGTLADRLGYKPMIVAGCVLRTVGLRHSRLVDSLPALIVASAATGFAGALFNPAVRAYLAADAGERRVEAFALFNVFYQAGILLGPLVGLVLTGVDFRVICLVAAGIFAAADDRPDPRAARPPGRRAAAGAGRRRSAARPVARGARQPAVPAVLPAMIGSYVLTFQVYLALPLEVRGSVVTASSARPRSRSLWGLRTETILGQTRVTAWCKARYEPGQALVRGVAVMGLAFVPLALAAPLVGDAVVPQAASPTRSCFCRSSVRRCCSAWPSSSSIRSRWRPSSPSAARTWWPPTTGSTAPWPASVWPRATCCRAGRWTSAARQACRACRGWSWR